MLPTTKPERKHVTHVGDDIGLVHVNHPKAPFALAANDDNPMVVTLRNTWYLVDNLMSTSSGGKSGTGVGAPPPTAAGKWGSLLSALKIGTLVSGGFALFSFASDAKASTHDRTEDEELEEKKRRASDLTDTSTSVAAQKEREEVPWVASTPEGEGLSVTTPEDKKVKAGTKSALSAKVSDSKSVVGTKGKVHAGESVDSAIARAATDTGEDVTWLRAMIHLESKGDPRAKNGQYLGLGQVGKSAWSDVQREGGLTKFPDITGGSNDPRYDPYTNALATATFMGQNRRAIKSAAKEAGYEKVTLGLLYAAHNIGAGSVRKILKESDSSKWDDQTKGYINNQASELKVGGVGNYLRNTEQSMAKHYASANVSVSSRQVAEASDSGVMSSDNPPPSSVTKLASRSGGDRAEQVSAQKQPSAAVNVPMQVAQGNGDRNPQAKNRTPSSPRADNAPGKQVAQQQTDSGGYSQGSSSSATYTTSEPKLFRLRNGNMAVI